ncbi:hypothetical protein J6590_070040 [Homalodisca vitripennis]|nr:hypothetical protein J6590_070040 [Homalodisca vitripennis]
MNIYSDNLLRQLVWKHQSLDPRNYVTTAHRWDRDYRDHFDVKQGVPPFNGCRSLSDCSWNRGEYGLGSCDMEIIRSTHKQCGHYCLPFSTCLNYRHY